MTREEAKEVFLNRGFIKVNGGTLYDPDKWRDACSVISEWLKEQKPIWFSVSERIFLLIVMFISGLLLGMHI